MENALGHVRFFPSKIEHLPSEAGSQLRTEAKNIIRLMFGKRKQIAAMCP